MSTRRKELEASWARTRGHLENALVRLPASLLEGDECGLVQAYREWLDHNELELALDALETLGEENPVEASFWGFLLEAATEMKLHDHAKRYREMQTG